MNYIYVPTATLNLIKIFGQMSSARDIPSILTLPTENGAAAFQSVLDITCEMINDDKIGLRHFLAPTTFGRDVDGPMGRDITLPPDGKIDINLKDAFAYLAKRQPGTTPDLSIMAVSNSQMAQIFQIHQFAVDAHDCSPERKADLALSRPERRLGIAADYLLNVMSALKGSSPVFTANALPGMPENREVVRPLQLGVARNDGLHAARPIKGLNF